MNRRGWIGSVVLLVVVVGVAGGLAAWKYMAMQAADAASASPPEPLEAVTAAVARRIQHREMVTSIGTVLALRSITLRNELAGTVRHVAFTSGQVVEAGAVLVALDTSVEEAELRAQEAQAALAETLLGRMERAVVRPPLMKLGPDEIERLRRAIAEARLATAGALDLAA